jgi:hypothetical protein
MILFKTKTIETEFKTIIHPDVRLMLVEFAQWSADRKLPQPFLTCLKRSRDEQVALYVGYWLALQGKLVQYESQPEAAHKWQGLFASPVELRLAQHIKNRTAAEFRDMAMRRETWHWYSCAADLRTVGDIQKPYYSRDQLASVEAWFKKRCPTYGDNAEWELKTETHGTGPHIHVARRALDWKAKMGVS